jgi:hypothetical protein
MSMNEKALEGLKVWAKGRKTSTIKEHLEGKAEDPEALAVWIRKQALGEEEFKRHQEMARKKK